MAEPVRIQGRWWCPASPERTIDGILFLDAERSAVLELHGSFHAPSPVEAISRMLDDAEFVIPAVNGIGLDGMAYTLLGCRLEDEGINITNPELASQTYTARSVYEGCHVSAPEEIAFREIVFRIAGLEEWLDICGLDVSRTGTGADYRITYANPETRQFTLADGVTCTLRSRPTFPLHGRFRMGIGQESEIAVDFGRALPVDDILAFLQTMQGFFTFALGRPTFFTRIAGRGDTCSANIRLFCSRLTEPAGPQAFSSQDALFTYPAVAETIAPVLSGWFAFTERYPTVLQNYFATVTSADRYPEHGFLSLCQCMEIYHRQAPQFCDAVTDPEVHAERIAVVTGALKADGRLNSDTRRTFVRLLKKFGNRPNLEARILEIVTFYGSDIDPLVEDPARFAKAVSVNRNNLTHHDPKPREEYASRQGLAALSLQLQAVLTIVICREIGVGDAVVAAYVRAVADDLRERA